MIADSILLIHSHELGWDTVRITLQEWMPRRSYHDLLSARAVKETIVSVTPKVILASDVLDGETSFPTLEMLRDRFGMAPLISVFAGDTDPVTIHQFAQLDLNGFFQWKELRTSISVTTALRAALTPGLISGTAAIVYMYFQLSRNLTEGEIGLRATSRQRQILRLLVEGRPYDSIARELNCSTRTIVREIDRSMDALAVENIHALIHRATLVGLLP